MKKNMNIIAIAVLSFYPIVGMGIDLISPSLPAISHQLHTSTHFSKNLITIYLLGYATGNLIIGVLSDVLGRRFLMLFGFLFFIIASLLPVFFEIPSVLLLTRLCQGLTTAAFAVTSRAVLADILPKEKLIKYATLIATMWGIGPIIGPMIGGYLQFYFNWKACFYFFALLGFLGLLATFFVIPETHFHRQPFQYSQLKQNFIMILAHRTFMAIVILMGLTYSILIAFNVLAPFLIQTSLGYSSIYFGHVSFVLGLTFLLGTFICRRLLQSFMPEKLFFYAIFTFTLMAAIGVIAAIIYPHNIWFVIMPSLVMFIACGIIYPTAMGMGLSLFRHLAGSGSAVMSFINILITSLTAFSMSYLYVDNAIPLTLIYFILMLLSATVYHFMFRSKTKS